VSEKRMQRFPECSAITLYVFDTLAEITGTFVLEKSPLSFDGNQRQKSVNNVKRTFHSICMIINIMPRTLLNV